MVVEIIGFAERDDCLSSKAINEKGLNTNVENKTTLALPIV